MKKKVTILLMLAFSILPLEALAGPTAPPPAPSETTTVEPGQIRVQMGNRRRRRGRRIARHNRSFNRRHGNDNVRWRWVTRNGRRYRVRHY